MANLQICSMLKYIKVFFIFLLVPIVGKSQVVKIAVDANSGKKSISPYLFGKNNVLPSTYLNDGSNDEVTKSVEAGIKMVRQSGGNNSTKYNWRNKLSSHPDWYNNVYSNDWDAAAKNLTDKLPGVQGMWSFQLLGKVAANDKNNFGDWNYNRSQWWQGVHQNLAGGGVVNPNGAGKALTEGNINLYLQDWPADSTVAILDHWFSKNDLGYDPTFYQYWSMDNEPEIWSGTHDDVMKTQMPAEEFMQRYFKVAKAARAKYPNIKLVGPVPANEWQWYRYGNDGIPWNGKKYAWLEYFILRISEEEKASGVKLLDVLDIHYYPSASDAAQLVQFHRVFFDRNYVYPEANGVKTVEGGWNENIKQEYIFGRCADWLTKYLGANHGVTFAMTECGINSSDANVQASFYASMMGEFMKNGVEIFTPWSWQPGMWETLHLFSRYGQEDLVSATSTDETFVSAYPTINATADSMTIFLVNRHTSATKEVQLDVSNFIAKNQGYQFYTLSKLPSSETFISHSQNALKQKTINKTASAITLQLEPLSINALVLVSSTTTSTSQEDLFDKAFQLYPNPTSGLVNMKFTLPKASQIKMDLYNGAGQQISRISNAKYGEGQQFVELDLSAYPAGMYWIKLTGEGFSGVKKVLVSE